MHIELLKGDITKVEVDAIVNAANSALAGGGGVDGAIHRAGGPAIMEECNMIRRSQGGCAPGEAVITTGGKLPARFVIHTVGPVWEGGKKNEKDILASSYRNSLRIAHENKLFRIAFPNISTGVYGYPKPLAAAIAVNTVKEFVTRVQAEWQVIFVCYDDENHKLYQALL